MTTLDVRPLSGTIGAEIRSLDLREPLDPDTVAELRALWLRYKVVPRPVVPHPSRRAGGRRPLRRTPAAAAHQNPESP